MPPIGPPGAHPQTSGLPGSGGAQPAGGAASGAISFDALAEIATGATAQVELCRVTPPHPRAGTLIAVKRLHPHIAEDPTFVKQFLDEVRFTYWLRHPNVVEVAGWGTDTQGSYLAVELVQGVSLLRLMKTIFDTGEAFTERMVVYIACRICQGLSAAHSLRAPDGEILNLVHRDLTPGNVLVGFSGEVKITDFGMAKAKQRLTKTLTGMRKGEPTYMAPEQARSDDIDARADLFSLGVMLFELFAGRRPWIAKSDYEMVQVVSRDPPADLHDLRPKIDRELVSVVNRCLEKDPAARFQSAHEIALRLEEWLTVHGYQEGNDEALGRFVRRNAMRQMRWFERAIAGELSPERVGREAPRVPTYTEHTKKPDDLALLTPSVTTPPRLGAPPVTTGAPPGSMRRPLPAPPAIPAGRPLVPPRVGGAPADPRSLRAAQAVQQLKKLAPPVEPPRARSRRTPTLDEDEDATDVELRIGPAANPRASLASRPQSAPPPDDDDGDGEEIPTLVQKGDDEIQALRADARAKHAAKQAAQGKLPFAAPHLIADEESDQRITEVKREKRREEQLARFARIDDHESDLPTAPIASGRPHPPLDPEEAPTPIAPQRVRQTPVNLGAPAEQRHRGRVDIGGPQMRQIPRSPDIPPRPFPVGPPGRPKPALPPPADAPGNRRPTGRPPPPEPPPARNTARPPPPPVPVVAPAPPIARPSDPMRVSHHDDVEVIDRSALSAATAHAAQAGASMTEDALLAEADRLAIEAVRRSEEARAAQIRADRKSHAAKLAGEAAMIAAEAVRIIRSSGLPAAIARLEEARTLEQNLQSGKLPAGDLVGSLRPVSMGGPERTPPDSMGAPISMGAPVSTPSSFPGPSSGAGGSRPPPPDGPSSSGQSYLSPGTPTKVPIFAGAASDASRPSYAPAPPLADGGHDAYGRPSAPPAAPMAGPAPARPIEADAFQGKLRPSILGTPSGALVALALVGLGVVAVLILLLTK